MSDRREIGLARLPASENAPVFQPPERFCILLTAQKYEIVWFFGKEVPIKILD